MKLKLLPNTLIVLHPLLKGVFANGLAIFAGANKKRAQKKSAPV